MDGLLFDTETIYGKEWEKLARLYGFTVSQQMMNDLYGTSGAFMESIVKHYVPHMDPTRLIMEIFENARKTLSDSVPVKPGVYELLDYLKEQKVKIAVASSSPMDLIEKNLRLTGITSYFDVIVSGEQVEHGKPDPDIFLLAAKKLGLEAADCYVLEDGINGVYAGVRAGCATIMVPDMAAPNEEIGHICIGIYDSLSAVLNAIKEEKLP